MSPMLCSQGMVLATAMAVSGTVILLALRLQKSFPPSLLPMEQIPQAASSHQEQVLRSCISSEGKKKKKKKLRVHFAEDVVDPKRDGKKFRRQRCANSGGRGGVGGSAAAEATGLMPENRTALYNGILRDRLSRHSLAYSY